VYILESFDLTYSLIGKVIQSESFSNHGKASNFWRYVEH